jgi:hypothetical protein
VVVRALARRIGQNPRLEKVLRALSTRETSAQAVLVILTTTDLSLAARSRRALDGADSESAACDRSRPFAKERPRADQIRTT